MRHLAVDHIGAPLGSTGVHLRTSSRTIQHPAGLCIEPGHAGSGQHGRSLRGGPLAAPAGSAAGAVRLQHTTPLVMRSFAGIHQAVPEQCLGDRVQPPTSPVSCSIFAKGRVRNVYCLLGVQQGFGFMPLQEGPFEAP